MAGCQDMLPPPLRCAALWCVAFRASPECRSAHGVNFYILRHQAMCLYIYPFTAVLHPVAAAAVAALHRPVQPRPPSPRSRAVAPCLPRAVASAAAPPAGAAAAPPRPSCRRRAPSSMSATVYVGGTSFKQPRSTPTFPDPPPAPTCCCCCAASVHCISSSKAARSAAPGLPPPPVHVVAANQRKCTWARKTVMGRQR